MQKNELCFLACSALLLSLPAAAQEMPAGTTLQARLSGATGSHISHAGDSIEATIIAPVSVDGRILVPQGSKLLGSIVNATAIGFGLKHTTASLAYDFHTLELPDGSAIAVNTQLVEVDTAKELVDDLGIVHGIHPVVSLASSLAFYTVPLLLVEPEFGVPILGMKALIAPSANAEISFPRGTELSLRLTSGVTLPAPDPDFAVPTESLSQGDLNDVADLLKASSQRAYLGNRPSDLVNVLLIGTRSQMDRAFHASGWSLAQRKSPISLYRMYHALTKRRGYPKAPMNALTLNGAPSAFVRQKSLDTVQKRHHVRLWQVPEQPNVWIGAAAEDDGFRFELTHWTHSTDPNIDSERAKVVNDLAFTGCVNAAGLLSRSLADLVQDPKEEHIIRTDGDVAVIRLNDCLDPKLMAGVGEASARQQHGRLTRTLTAFRDDLARSNMFSTTYNTFRLIAKHKVEPATVNPRSDADLRGLAWLTPYSALAVAPPR